MFLMHNFQFYKLNFVYFFRYIVQKLQFFPIDGFVRFHIVQVLGLGTFGGKTLSSLRKRGYLGEAVNP